MAFQNSIQVTFPTVHCMTGAVSLPIDDLPIFNVPKLVIIRLPKVC